MGPDAMIFVFWMLSFNPTFSLFSFTFKRLFSSSSLSVIRVVSTAYLRLLMFLPAILIPACASSSPVFLMMYSSCLLRSSLHTVKLISYSFKRFDKCLWLRNHHHNRDTDYLDRIAKSYSVCVFKFILKMPDWLHQFPFSPAMNRSSGCSIFLTPLSTVCFFLKSF